MYFLCVTSCNFVDDISFPRTPYELHSDLAFGLVATIRICFSGSVLGSSSVLPSGKPLVCRTWPRISTICCLLSRPSLFGGIVRRTLSYRSPTVRLSQFPRKAGPESGGASSLPVSSVPWHDAHS